MDECKNSHDAQDVTMQLDALSTPVQRFSSLRTPPPPQKTPQFSLFLPKKMIIISGQG